MKREKPVVSSKLARLTERVVSLAQKAVVGDPDPTFEEGKNGYADWVIVTIHGLREYLDHTFRRLLDVLHERHGIVAQLGDVQAIDATGMDRIAASQHYAKRTNYTFEAVKTTLLSDCETGTILDIHC